MLMLSKVIKASKKKEAIFKKDLSQYVYKAIFAGVAIDLGMIFSNQVMMMYGKLPGAIAFSLGLLLIIFLGGELFTGNTAVMTIGFAAGEVGLLSTIIILVISYICNFIGCCITSYAFYFSGIPGSKEWYSDIVTSKLSVGTEQLLFRAILCNVFVCLAVILGIVLENEVAKLLMVVLCISAFITCGFEHCIANMGVFTVDMMFRKASFLEIFTVYGKHMLIVTIGNIIGGAIFVAPWFIMTSSKEGL